MFQVILDCTEPELLPQITGIEMTMLPRKAGGPPCYDVVFKAAAREELTNYWCDYYMFGNFNREEFVDFEASIEEVMP